MTDRQYLIQLGTKILKARQSIGMTQAELAKKLRTGEGQIRRVEKGQVNSTINMLRKIAKELGTSINELIKI